MGSPIALSLAAFKRTGFPESVLVNCAPEKAPTQQSSPVALRARGGHEAFKTVGSAPFRGVFSKVGLFSDAAIVIAQTEVYTLDAAGTTTLLSGAVAGNGLVAIDGGLDADLNPLARVANGSAMYKIQAGVVTQEDFPEAGGAGATDVCFGPGQVWIGLVAGSDQFYLQGPGTTTWSALSFASSEYAPDPGVAVRRLGDIALFLNATTTEAWTPSGTATLLEPYGGLKFDFGCRARASAVSCPGAIIWVDNNCEVRLFEGGEPQIISDNGLAEQIRRTDATDLRGSFYVKDGHKYYVLTLGTTATWRYDLAMQSWSRADSYGYDFLRPNLHANLGDDVLALDAITNQVWRMDPDRRTDGSDTFTVRFMAFVEAKDGPIDCASIRLTCEVGNSPLSGQGSDPIIRMRYSDDQGKTWSIWRDRSLGATGKYSTIVQWNALGMIRPPYGRIFEFEVSDPVGRRFSDLWLNAA